MGRWFPVPGMEGRTWRRAFKAPGTVARRAIWPVIGGRREALSEKRWALCFTPVLELISTPTSGMEPILRLAGSHTK